MRIFLSLAIFVLSAGVAHAADPGAGRIKANAACAVCHGPSGIAMMPSAPHLAGQPSIYSTGRTPGFAGEAVEV